MLPSWFPEGWAFVPQRNDINQYRRLYELPIMEICYKAWSVFTCEKLQCAMYKVILLNSLYSTLHSWLTLKVSIRWVTWLYARPITERCYKVLCCTTFIFWVWNEMRRCHSISCWRLSLLLVHCWSWERSTMVNHVNINCLKKKAAIITSMVLTNTAVQHGNWHCW